MSRRSGRDRRHTVPGRDRPIFVRCSPEEYTAIAAAAAEVGLTPSGYVAEAAVAAASARSVAAGQIHRDAVQALMASRAQLRRYGNNVNQAVRAMNAGADAPPWLQRAVELADTAVVRIDVLVGELSRNASTGRATPRR
jgi:uncharacterized protein (DUF1778 family)